MNNNWSIQSVWQEFLLRAQETRETEQRDHVWASEIGKMKYERWLKMQGKEPDIDFDARTLRIFSVGNVFELDLVTTAHMAGILKDENRHIRLEETEDRLAVTGKPDLEVGGEPLEWSEIEDSEIFTLYERFFPNRTEVAKDIYEVIREDVEEQGFKDIIYEIKTVHSNAFWHSDGLPYDHHKLQLYTYLKKTGLEEGRVLYISKDDYCIEEYPIYLSNESLEKEWKQDLEEMTYYIRKDEEPEKPSDVIFEEGKSLTFQRDKTKFDTDGKWETNWELERSNYLPTITGYEDQDSWKKQAKAKAKTKNSKLKKEKIKELQKKKILNDNEKLTDKGRKLKQADKL